MAFSTESIDTGGPVKNPTGPAEFDLPVREFTGYDPKGTTTITGTDRSVNLNPKQETTTETVAESPPEESVKLSPQISAIARKEQAQRKREQALVQREKELESKLADAEKYAQLKSKLANKDYSAADELGMTYEEYTQYLLDKQNSENPEEQRYRSLEERQKATEKALEEQTVKEYNQNQALWKQEIAKVVSENEDFSTIKALGLEGMVLQHVNDSFDEDGVELTVEEAAREIEAEAIKRAEKFASVPKIKGRVEEAPKALGAPKTPKTITQNMTTSPVAAKSKPFHLMSESEQIAEAIRRVQAEKQSRR